MNTANKDIHKKKNIKKITETRLQNIAVYYLQRFGGTEFSVRNILKRRIEKSFLFHPEQNITDINQWMDIVIDRLKSYGYINDIQFATSRTKTLLKKGKSIKVIQSDLYKKGVCSDTISTVLSDYNNLKIQKQSVCIYVQKRKLGVYRYIDQQDIGTYLDLYQDYNSDYYTQHKKDLARCARQGFSFTDSEQALLGE